MSTVKPSLKSEYCKSSGPAKLNEPALTPVLAPVPILSLKTTTASMEKSIYNYKCWSHFSCCSMRPYESIVSSTKKNTIALISHSICNCAKPILDLWIWMSISSEPLGEYKGAVTIYSAKEKTSPQIPINCCLQYINENPKEAYPLHLNFRIPKKSVFNTIVYIYCEVFDMAQQSSHLSLLANYLTDPNYTDNTLQLCISNPSYNHIVSEEEYYEAYIADTKKPKPLSWYVEAKEEDL